MKWPITKPASPRRSAHTYQRHGQEFSDPYNWLRDNDWQAVVRDPAQLDLEIRQHLEAENQYAQSMLNDVKPLQDLLLNELKARIPPDDREVPARDGSWFYNTRFRPNAEHPLFVRYPATAQANPDMSEEQVLLDASLMAEPHDFFQIGTLCHSPDHSKIAWTQDVHGSEFFEIFIKDINAQTTIKTGIVTASADLLWMADSAHLLWVWRDENSRPKQVRCHKIGTDPANDRVLYSETDDGFFLGLSQTSDREFALIECRDHQTTEVHILPLNAPEELPTCLWPRTIGIEVDVEHLSGVFTLLSNAQGATDFQIFRITAPNRHEHPQIIVPHRPGVLLLDQLQFADFHVRLQRENAKQQIIIRTEADGSEHSIQFEQEAYALGLIAGFEFDTHILRFAFSSPSTPRQVFDYDMRKRQRTLLKQASIPSGHDPDSYEVQRLFAPAADGQMIPVTLLRRKSVAQNTPAPLVLYGYGAYGNSVPAGFSANRMSLVNRGVSFAIAHVRGGKEKGFAWYDQGRRQHKTNTFSDFIACAEFLIEQNITASGKIVAYGGSAGGMLTGAVLNARPELFAGIVAQVPFVDVLTTMSDPSLPLTPPEWPEWGNPITSTSDFETIASYCPLSNVTAQDYPPVLATAGLTDTRVTWWEPAKWIATLRHEAPNGGPYLLVTEMSAGHGGASGRYSELSETALIQSFILKTLGKCESY